MVKFVVLAFILWIGCVYTCKALTNHIDSGQVNTVRAYIINHPNEAKSLRLLKELSFTYDHAIIAPLYKLLGTRLKQTPAGLKFGKTTGGYEEHCDWRSCP